MTNKIMNFSYSLRRRSRNLPPHPNIVQIFNVFTDAVQALPGSLSLYPDALPSRINPNGYGRNMSLFLLMKRYNIYSYPNFLFHFVLQLFFFLSTLHFHS